MGKVIRLTEQDLHNIVCEVIKEYGAVWKNNDGNTSLSVDSDPNVNNNSYNKMNVDTRVFGTKDDILNYKANGHSKSLTDNYNSKKAALQTYYNVIEWVKNGRKGKPKYSKGLDTYTQTILDRRINSLPDNELINFIEKAIERTKLDNEIYANKFNRVSNSNETEPIMRYNVFNVPGTDIKCITLFTMSDFNFSDAIKHGSLRGNNKTNTITGDDISSKSSNKIQLTYDNNVKPNIAQNFSLDNVKDGHYKQQYPNGGYTSINQFIDKSVVYGANVLKKINYIPDFIVSAPSSSQFNNYFCINLSRKLGAEYISDFFKRNVVNVKLADGSDPQTLKEKGFTDSEITMFTSVVKNLAYNEINYLVCKPIQEFVKRHEEFFLTVPSQPNAEPKRGRMADKLTIPQIISVLCRISYTNALKEVGQDKYIEYITKVLTYTNDKNKIKQLPIDKMYENILKFSGIGKNKKIYNEYLNVCQQFTANLSLYADKLSEGFTPKYVENQFKITKLDKRFRGYLQNVYVIADKNMTGEMLQTRYQNAKFLIYDEDVNSGATLRLVVDALNEKLPDGKHQIICLANAYSNSGR